MKIQFNDTFKLGDPEETLLWLVDIVGYSKVSNLSAQEQLIKNLFNCVFSSVTHLGQIVSSNSKLEKYLTSDDATVIWTGDGAIIATKFPFGLESPLLLTSLFKQYWLQEDWSIYFHSTEKKEPPKTHIAAHHGKCRWLRTPTLRSPLFEVSNCFGVDINFLSRIATFSSEMGDCIISDDYFNKLKCADTTFRIRFPNGLAQSIRFSELISVKGKEEEIFNYRTFHFF